MTGANALVSGVSEAHRATALNLVNLFFGLGGLATPFISANLFKKNWVRLCYTVAGLTVATLVIQTVTQMPAPSGNAAFTFAHAGDLFGHPLLFLLGLFLFLYISCEVGVWNWLPRHLIAQGVPESRALNILSLGFALGLLHWPGRGVARPDSRFRGRCHAGGFNCDGDHDVPDVAHQQSHRCLRTGVSCRAFNGAGLSDDAGDCGHGLSKDERNRNRFRDHLRLGRACRELEHHWSRSPGATRGGSRKRFCLSRDRRC